jgi:lipopolysaccharide transport system ATP-binding protein
LQIGYITPYQESEIAMSREQSIAIKIKNLTKTYQLKPDNSSGHTHTDDFYALRDISFDVDRGDVIGIIGSNGSGKSTLLRILSRITKPSAGEANFYGTVSSILDIGTNFHPDLTGRENVNMHLHLAGIPKKEFKERHDAIQNFSEIAEFFDQPVKVYSSGMFLRLAFSMAFHLSSDILLLDEVLSVGDEGFRLKCNEMLKELTTKDKTILFVSHSRTEVLELSTKCLWLDKGMVKKFDNPTSVLGEYFSMHRENFDQKKLVIETAHANPSHSVELNGAIDITWEEKDAPGNDILSIRELSVYAENAEGKLYNNQPIHIKFVVNKKKAGIHIGSFFFLQDVFYQPVLVGHFLNNIKDSDFSGLLKEQTGLFEIKCTIPPDFLTPGKYYLFPRFGMEEAAWNITSKEVFRFSEKLNFIIHPFTGFSDLIGDISKGSVRPKLDWEIEKVLD